VRRELVNRLKSREQKRKGKLKYSILNRPVRPGSRRTGTDGNAPSVEARTGIDGKDGPGGHPPISIDLSVHNKNLYENWYNYADRDARSVNICFIRTISDSVSPKIKPCCTHDFACKDIQ